MNRSSLAGVAHHESVAYQGSAHEARSIPRHGQQRGTPPIFVMGAVMLLGAVVLMRERMRPWVMIALSLAAAALLLLHFLR